MPTKHHPNTIRLIRIEDEAINLGWYRYYPKVCFSSEVARRSNEEGEENPSDKAIKIASRMLNELREMVKLGKRTS